MDTQYQPYNPQPDNSLHHNRRTQQHRDHRAQLPPELPGNSRHFNGLIEEHQDHRAQLPPELPDNYLPQNRHTQQYQDHRSQLPSQRLPRVYPHTDVQLRRDLDAAPASAPADLSPSLPPASTPPTSTKSQLQYQYNDPPAKSSVVYDLTGKVLPVLFLTLFFITGAVIIVYTLVDHRALPQKFIIGVSIAFGIILFFLFFLLTICYCRKRHHSDRLLESGRSTRSSVRGSGSVLDSGLERPKEETASGGWTSNAVGGFVRWYKERRTEFYRWTERTARNKQLKETLAKGPNHLDRMRAAPVARTLPPAPSQPPRHTASQRAGMRRQKMGKRSMDGKLGLRIGAGKFYVDPPVSTIALPKVPKGRATASERKKIRKREASIRMGTHPTISSATSERRHVSRREVIATPVGPVNIPFAERPDSAVRPSNQLSSNLTSNGVEVSRQLAADTDESSRLGRNVIKFTRGTNQPLMSGAWGESVEPFVSAVDTQVYSAMLPEQHHASALRALEGKSSSVLTTCAHVSRGSLQGWHSFGSISPTFQESIVAVTDEQGEERPVNGYFDRALIDTDSSRSTVSELSDEGESLRTSFQSSTHGFDLANEVDDISLKGYNTRTTANPGVVNSSSIEKRGIALHHKPSGTELRFEVWSINSSYDSANRIPEDHLYSIGLWNATQEDRIYPVKGQQIRSDAKDTEKPPAETKLADEFVSHAGHRKCPSPIANAQNRAQTVLSAVESVSSTLEANDRLSRQPEWEDTDSMVELRQDDLLLKRLVGEYEGGLMGETEPDESAIDGEIKGKFLEAVKFVEAGTWRESLPVGVVE